jgi:MOSC domain-containing protein YiiM
MPGRLESVNVSLPRSVQLGDRALMTGIFKKPVEGRVPLSSTNLRGDSQADRKVHGGPEKAVYAYSLEDTRWWAELFDASLEPGAFGENLSTTGLDVSGALIGERWSIGSTLLEVSQPRLPCVKLGLRFGDPRFVSMFAAAGRPGAYLRVLAEGQLGAGDAIEVVHSPGHGITCALVAHVVLRERKRAAEVLAAPELSDEMRAMLRDGTLVTG